MGLFTVMVSHFLACCFLPWTPRQAAAPIAVVLVVAAIARFAFGGDTGWAITMTAISPFVAVPGVAVCWVRHARRFEEYRLRFFQKRYGEVQGSVTS